MAGTVRAVGSGCRLKPGDNVYCVYPHHFDTAVVLHEDQCELLSTQESADDLLGQVHPLVTSLHLAGLLRLDSGNQVLIDCEEIQLAYMLSQVALVRCSEVYITCRSGSALDKFQRLGAKARLVDRQAALRQISLGNLFDAVLTDSNDDFHSLGKMAKPNGHIIALRSSAPADMVQAAGYFLKKGVTIGVFDPMNDFATAATRRSMTSTVVETCSASNGPLQKQHTPLAEAFDLLRRGAIEWFPCERFDLAQLPEAINRVAQDNFAGSVITTRTTATQVPVRAFTEPLTFNPDASYLLVGCLGGLGRSLT